MRAPALGPVVLLVLAAVVFPGGGRAADRIDRSEGASSNPLARESATACNRLGRKLTRQRSGLARARNTATRAVIRGNIGVTRRLRRLACHPQPSPRLPRDFRGSGRYLLPDLGVNVPFTWRGRDGNSQMIAGGENYPIYFMNLIFGGSLYTITYRWPGVTDHPCSRIPGFTLDQLNQLFGTAAYVGTEILNRNRRRYVNHFRLASALPPGPSWALPPDSVRRGRHLRRRERSNDDLESAPLRLPESLRPEPGRVDQHAHLQALGRSCDPSADLPAAVLMN